MIVGIPVSWKRKGSVGERDIFLFFGFVVDAMEVSLGEGSGRKRKVDFHRRGR